MISAGNRSVIDDTVKVLGNVNIEIGDCSYIGPGVKIAGSGTVKIGDYCKIHSGTFMNLDGGSIVMGHNCWVGERSVIDGRGTLTMGNNVGVGIGSQLYSHIAHGDTIEGCKLYGNKPLVLDDDVWLVGQCFVAPVHAKKKSIAMLGAVIIKDMDHERIYSGNPAIDVTEKLGSAWIHQNNDQKMQSLQERITQYLGIFPDRASSFRKFVIPCIDLPEITQADITYIDVSERKYTKRGTNAEIDFLSWLTSYKGRFTPFS